MRQLYHFFFLLLITFVFAGSVHALVQVNSYYLDQTYSSGENIRGIVNVTLTGTPYDSQLRTATGEETTLGRLLEAQQSIPSKDYLCSTAACVSLYTPVNHSSSLYGIRVSGEHVENVQLSGIAVHSPDRASCYPSLFVDILDRGNFPFVSSSYKDQTCGLARQGCFNGGLGESEYEHVSLSGREYCEKILLPLAPAFRIGADVQGQGPIGLTLSLRKTDGTTLRECLITSNESSSCIVPYPNAVQNQYLVCVRGSFATNYTMRSEKREPCGTTNGGVNFTADYDIFAQPLAFDQPLVEITSSGFSQSTGMNSTAVLDEYLESRYRSTCNPYCIIPFRVYGSASSHTVRSVSVSYERDNGERVVEANIIPVEKRPALVTSGSLLLNLSYANFTVAPDMNQFKLYLDNTLIARTVLHVIPSFNFELAPLFTTPGASTIFSISSTSEITQTKWNFGDGISETTNRASLSHIYSYSGSYFVTIEATRADGSMSVKNYTVLVGDPKITAETILNEYSNRISGIEHSIAQYPSWMKDALSQQINVAGLKSDLQQKQSQYSTSTTSEHYKTLVNQLINLDIPASVSVDQNNQPLLIGIENMDPVHIQKISNQTMDREEVKNAILVWMNRNYRPEVHVEHINLVYENRKESILTRASIETKPLTPLRSDTYLIIGKPTESLLFPQEQQVPQSLTDATYFTLDQGDQKFEFATKEDITAEDLGSYISPSVEVLAEFAASYALCDFDTVCDQDLGEAPGTCSDCKESKVAQTLALLVSFFVIMALAVWVYTRYQPKPGGRKVY